MKESLRAVVVRAEVKREGHFVFVDGQHALVKVEMDHLWEHENALSSVLEALAVAEGLTPADAMIGVPRGGQRLAEALHDRGLFDIPLINIERVPGGAKRDFRFCSLEDRERAERARVIRIYEDVVSTLSSVAGVVKILQPEMQRIESFAIWKRGEPLEKYRIGVKDFYLIEEDVESFTPDNCPVCNPVKVV